MTSNVVYNRPYVTQQLRDIVKLAKNFDGDFLERSKRAVLDHYRLHLQSRTLTILQVAEEVSATQTICLTLVVRGFGSLEG